MKVLLYTTLIFLFICLFACIISMLFAIISVMITGINDVPYNFKLFKLWVTTILKRKKNDKRRIY